MYVHYWEPYNRPTLPSMVRILSSLANKKIEVQNVNHLIKSHTASGEWKSELESKVHNPQW